jgi:hypothetical protein
MNGRSKRATVVAVVCLNILIAVSSARAAEIAILSSRNVQPEMDAIIPGFERSSGHKVAISYAATPEFIDRWVPALTWTSTFVMISPVARSLFT